MSSAYKSNNVGIENVRQYWNRQPCNINHSSSPIGSIEYFDQVETRKYFVEPHIPVFADFVRWRDKNVLEVGCGIGTDAVNFCRAGANYVGIDLSSESISLAAKRLEVYDLEAVLDCVDIEEIDAKTPWLKHFDLIYSFGVLHHTVNIGKALRSIRNLCHAETTFKLMVYAKNSWKQKMIDAGLDQPEAQYGCPIANSYTSDEITAILLEAGFKVVSLTQDHIFPYKVQEYRKYQYVKEPHFQVMAPEIFRVLEKNFGWHLMIEAMPI